MCVAVSLIALSITTNNFPNLKRRITYFLDYAATYPAAKLVYKASEMHMWAHSDALYLCNPKACSRAGGFVYLSNKPILPVNATSIPPTSNTAVHIVCKLIDAVMLPAQETEAVSGFITAKELVPIRHTLEEMGIHRDLPRCNLINNV